MHHSLLILCFNGKEEIDRVILILSSFVQVIEKESAEVEARSELVRNDEAVANQKASESQALKEECESDLAEAIPALEAALAALNTLKVQKTIAVRELS